LDGLVGAGGAVHHRRGRVNDCNRLTTGRAVAATIHGLPDASCIKGIAAVTGCVGHRTQDCNRKLTAVVRGGWRVEGPGGSDLNGFIRAARAIHHGRSSVNDRDRLTARHGVAAIGRLPDTGRFKRAPAVAGAVGDSAHNGHRHAAIVVRSGGCIKGPGCSELNGLVGAGGTVDGWRGAVDNRHRLAASGAIAASVHGLPDARSNKRIGTVARAIGCGA